LKPAYEKAAKNLAGLAKVAAINCDEEDNKPFCGSMGVQGFPTLKIVKPGKKAGRPVVEDYQGQRTTKAIVDAVVDKIPNHVKKLKEDELDAWLGDNATKAKAILFTEKGTTSALIRSIAIDFLGSIGVAQIRNKDQAAVEKFGITQFPTIVLIPGDEAEPILYTDEMKKQPLVDLLSQVATPNPDPAPKKSKASKSSKPAKEAKKSSTASSAFSEASEAHKSSDFEDFAGASTIGLDDLPTESPLPIVEDQQKPMVVEEAAPPIPTLATAEELDKTCIAPKSGTCVLVLLPVASDGESTSAADALSSFAEIAQKHEKRRDHTFPFYAIPSENERANSIRAELGLKTSDTLEIIAVNKKRGWWRRYALDAYDAQSIDSFVDAIKLGEGTKEKLPGSFGDAQAQTVMPDAPAPASEPEVDATNTIEDASNTDPEPAATVEAEAVHDEL
jgi:protein disulfide-isomerase A6